MEELSGISSLAPSLISCFPACESQERSFWESYSITSLGPDVSRQSLLPVGQRPAWALTGLHGSSVQGLSAKGLDLKLCLMRAALHLVLM